jgi:large subunit ribosomal protein L25
MKSITIKGSERSVGKVATKALRNAGRFLACYTEEISQYIFSTRKSIQNLVTLKRSHSCDRSWWRKIIYCYSKDIQVHPVTDDILHIDFFQIFGDKEITIEVPVKIIGDSRSYGWWSLRLNNRKLKVKALPKNLPDFVEVILPT